MMTDIIIQRMQSNNVKQVAEMILEYNLGYWSELDLEQEIKRSDSIGLIAKKSRKVVGFIIARLIMLDFSFTQKHNVHDLKAANSSNEIEIYNIAVSKNLRRKQIGKLLINHLLANFAQAGSAVVWLEVRESNISAIDFYKSNSFTFCYKRRNFYTNPNENAIIMKLETESSKNWKK